MWKSPGKLLFMLWGWLALSWLLALLVLALRRLCTGRSPNQVAMPAFEPPSPGVWSARPVGSSFPESQRR
jgi:hypothetical protein